MANESASEVIEAVAEPLPGDETAAGEGRLNVASTAFQTAVLQYITGQAVSGTVPAAAPGAGVQRMVLVATTMPTAGAAPGLVFSTTALTPTPVAPTTTNSLGPAITWGAVSGGGAAVSTTTSNAVVFNAVPPGNYVGYAVYNPAGLYLYSKAFTAIAIPGGATGTITVTATHTYDLN